jgi:hypothetical protein
MPPRVLKPFSLRIETRLSPVTALLPTGDGGKLCIEENEDICIGESLPQVVGKRVLLHA